MKSAEEIKGVEYDWLASDETGHVALFSTAGGGYAPVQFLRETDAHDAAIDALLALPVSTVAGFAPALAPGAKNTWKLVAERGLFAFDGNPNGDGYRLVAAPLVPRMVDTLPVVAQSVVSRLRLELRFDARSIVTADELRRGP